jgi:hypothetical protein
VCPQERFENHWSTGCIGLWRYVVYRVTELCVCMPGLGSIPVNSESKPNYNSKHWREFEFQCTFWIDWNSKWISPNPDACVPIVCVLLPSVFVLAVLPQVNVFLPLSSWVTDPCHHGYRPRHGPDQAQPLHGQKDSVHDVVRVGVKGQEFSSSLCSQYSPQSNNMCHCFSRETWTNKSILEK